MRTVVDCTFSSRCVRKGIASFATLAAIILAGAFGVAALDSQNTGIAFAQERSDSAIRTPSCCSKRMSWFMTMTLKSSLPSADVQLDYDGYKVVAERVSYNQRTRRVIASGNVEIIEPDGNRIYADRIDLTDDFADGFVDALRVETRRQHSLSLRKARSALTRQNSVQQRHLYSVRYLPRTAG